MPSAPTVDREGRSLDNVLMERLGSSLFHLISVIWM
jgi:hypothetical protein